MFVAFLLLLLRASCGALTVRSVFDEGFCAE